MALDPGTVRVGVAVSDELGLIASPLEFIPAEPAADCLDRIRSLCAEKEVGQIVVGMPRNMDGTYGPAAEKARAFIETLRDGVRIPVRAWDERLTSKQADRALLEARVRREDRKRMVDKMAAAILLQSYLDSGAGSVTG